MIRAGYYQFCPEFGQVERNRDRVLRALDQVEADLVVLPELAFTGYAFRDRAELAPLAEDPARSETVDALSALCARRKVHLVTGFAERQGGRMYNSALLIGPRGLEHTYRKLHLFGNEKACFSPGNLPLAVQAVRGVRVGMMVCFDWAFPEVARSLALGGTDLLCHPSNLVLTYCQQTMLARCIENGVYAITANRTGVEARPHGGLTFTGQSQVVSPRGALLHRAPPEGDELYVVEIDPALARNKALTPQNDILGDRRPSFYGAITEKTHS